MRPCLFALLLFLPAAPAVAASPNPFAALAAHPTALRLRGAEDAPQLLVTARRADGREFDQTAAAKYTVSDPAVCRVEPDGRVIPLRNGSARVTASAVGLTVEVPVTVEAMGAPPAAHFANQVVPVLTKLGCNTGGCHGKIQGQNGFRLSLLGFDPEFDYTTIVREARGRRVLPAAPEQSLLLMKATGQVPHGGGRRTEPGSEEYKLLRRWVAAGTPAGDPADPKVVGIHVVPDHRVLDPQSRQQLAVYARYSDGAVEDVTRRAQYESNETEIAAVGDAGLVASLSGTGQAAVMVRFQGHVAVCRVAVPRTGPTPAWGFEPRTVVDHHTAAKWRELGLVPSAPCSDEQFARRAHLDITGTLPDPAAVAAFAADPAPDKRDRLVDRLLDAPEYGYHFAGKWADLLRVKRRGLPTRAAGTAAFHGWIKDAVAADKPFDQFVRGLLTATGDETTCPPTVWYKEVNTPEGFVDDVGQVFLGQRLACANCHHHPYEKWTQDDYWGMAAFFSRVGRKAAPYPGQPTANARDQKPSVYVKSSGTVVNKRTGQPAEPRPLDGGPFPVRDGDDPRAAFADWLTTPGNPHFPRAVANRYWAHFFGRGVVDPVDDLRVTNPPSNPGLLDALAQTFTDSKFSLKALVRTICKSRTYQLSAAPNEWNRADRQSFARFYPRRLPAEVVYDAVCKVTDSPPRFAGLPADRHAPTRAIMLPDEGSTSYFLDVLGRPQRSTACDCERVNDSTLGAALHLTNSAEVQGMIARPGGRADRLARDPRPDDEKVAELFAAALGGRPTPEQSQLAREHLSKHAGDRKQAYENITWALVNSKAFLFNQ